MDDQRQQLLLATLIGETCTALDHLLVMARVGQAPIAVVCDTGRNLIDLAETWPGASLPMEVEEVDRVVLEARLYATDRLDLLCELLNEK